MTEVTARDFCGEALASAGIEPNGWLHYGA